jgi:hypothetical protein
VLHRWRSKGQTHEASHWRRRDAPAGRIVMSRRSIDIRPVLLQSQTCTCLPLLRSKRAVTNPLNHTLLSGHAALSRACASLLKSALPSYFTRITPAFKFVCKWGRWWRDSSNQQLHLVVCGYYPETSETLLSEDNRVPKTRCRDLYSWFTLHNITKLHSRKYAGNIHLALPM